MLIFIFQVFHQVFFKSFKKFANSFCMVAEEGGAEGNVYADAEGNVYAEGNVLADAEGNV